MHSSYKNKATPSPSQPELALTISSERSHPARNLQSQEGPFNNSFIGGRVPAISLSANLPSEFGPVYLSSPYSKLYVGRRHHFPFHRSGNLPSLIYGLARGEKPIWKLVGDGSGFSCARPARFDWVGECIDEKNLSNVGRRMTSNLSMCLSIYYRST